MIRRRNIQPETMLRYVGEAYPVIVFPTPDDDAIATALTPTLNVAITLAGAGVINVPGSTTAAIMPVPVAPTFVCNAKTDTFQALVTGRDQFGAVASETIAKSQTDTTTQRGLRNIAYSRIDSIVFISYSSAGNVTVGWRFGGNDPSGNAESGQNQVTRVPLYIPTKAVADLIGVYIEDAGGGTFGAAVGTGAMLMAGVATFNIQSVDSTAGAPRKTSFTYVSGCTSQPTRPVRFRPILAPNALPNLT